MSKEPALFINSRAAMSMAVSLLENGRALSTRTHAVKQRGAVIGWAVQYKPPQSEDWVRLMEEDME